MYPSCLLGMKGNVIRTGSFAYLQSSGRSPAVAMPISLLQSRFRLEGAQPAAGQLLGA